VIVRRISVNVSKKYDVLIGRGLLADIGKLIKPICISNHVAIVTDDIVSELFLKIIESSLGKCGISSVSFIFPNGEKSKNIDTLSSILEFLAENQIRRNDTLIALGGGVVGDIAGLAASIYMRGISVIQVPTTLLSSVDSSVGGKTAIDLKHGKNLAGAFWQPSMVVCDVDIIESLPDLVFSEGMAEVIKCNLIKDLPIINWIEQGVLRSHLEDVVFYCVDLKREIVERDEYDVIGVRNTLNVGHTVAHAIEKLSQYKYSHGIAVGTGIVIESQISMKMGICSPDVVKRIMTAIREYNLMIYDMPWTPEEMVDAMKSDKKNRSSDVVFELPISFGNCKEVYVNPIELKTLLKTG
jgi:3-dehydroquinate synthase